MSELPKPTPSNQPPKETNDPSPINNPAAAERKKSWTLDQSLLATVALSIISLGALIVSIYQTQVLSQQQEVMAGQQRIMAEQQRIMTESAKAQLWPNVEIGRNRGFEDGITISMLDFTIGNTGTGPAIIEKVTVQYEGRYARDWGELFRLTNLPDTVSGLVNNATLSSGVLPAGQSTTVLGLSINQPLMEHMGRIIENEGFIITMCYRSVFNEYWLREHKFG